MIFHTVKAPIPCWKISAFWLIQTEFFGNAPEQRSETRLENLPRYVSENIR